VTYNVGIAPTMSALQASHDLSRVVIKPGVYYITHVYNDTDVYKKVNLRLCAERGALVGRIYGPVCGELEFKPRWADRISFGGEKASGNHTDLCDKLTIRTRHVRDANLHLTGPNREFVYGT